MPSPDRQAGLYRMDTFLLAQESAAVCADGGWWLGSRTDKSAIIERPPAVASSNRAYRPRWRGHLPARSGFTKSSMTATGWWCAGIKPPLKVG